MASNRDFTLLFAQFGSLTKPVKSALNELVPPVVGGDDHRIYRTILVEFDAFEAAFSGRFIPAAKGDTSRHYNRNLSVI